MAKSNAQLKALMESTDYHGLFQTAYTLQPVGSYDSIGSANAYTNDVINSHPDAMEAVISGREPRAYLQKRYSSPTGREVDRKILPLGQVAEVFQPTFTVAVVVEHVPGRKGLRVVTSFPMKKSRTGINMLKSSPSFNRILDEWELAGHMYGYKFPDNLRWALTQVSEDKIDESRKYLERIIVRANDRELFDFWIESRLIASKMSGARSLTRIVIEELAARHPPGPPAY